MALDIHAHQNYLHTYLASPGFIKTVGWTQDGSSNMLVDQHDKSDSVVIVVGKFNSNRLYCGPQGNWSVGSSFGDLKSSKYQFTIGPADKEPFARDFEFAFKVIGQLQKAIASSSNCVHLLVGEGKKMHCI